MAMKKRQTLKQVKEDAKRITLQRIAERQATDVDALAFRESQLAPQPEAETPEEQPEGDEVPEEAPKSSKKSSKKSQ